MTEINYSWLDQLQDTTMDFTDYINTFSTATYTIKFSNRQPIIATVKNIFNKIVLTTDIKDKNTAFFQHNIREGELPEDIARRYYGTEDYWWVALIFNNITKPLTQWPVKDEALHYLADEFLRIEDKYSRSTYYDLLFENNEKSRKIDILAPEQLQELITQYKEKTTSDNIDSELNKQFTIVL